MEAQKKRAIQRLTVKLTDNINPGVLGPYLYQRQLLTRDEFERLSLPIMTTMDKNLFILQVCMRLYAYTHLLAVGGWCSRQRVALCSVLTV